MAEITGRDVHYDPFLTNMLIGYKNPMYIADMIAPIVPGTRQSAIIPSYDQSHWFRNQASLRAPGTRSRRAGFSTNNTATYFARRRSFGFEIPDEIRDNTDDPYSMDAHGTAFVGDKIMMVRELDWVTNFFTTGVWGTDRVGGTDFTQWSTYGTSDPLVNLTDYIDNVEARIGREANTLVLGKQVWTKLRWHPDLIDSIKQVQVGIVTEQILATLIGINKIHIGKAIYTTSPEGTAEGSVTYTRIWGKHALLLYVPDSPSIFEPAATYTFTWARVPNSVQYVIRHRDDQAELDIIEGNTYYDHKVTVARAGEFLQNAVA